ncbi:hypothetical protein SHab15497_00043 [Acinetobacter phage SH-Ab 15497]|nr:hypothetical protein SHab15497_00043 [Acinetobacter phage SH-Ab 15497]
MDIIDKSRTERLVEIVYGNKNGAPMDEEFKAKLTKCFSICKCANQEFEDKSLEFKLAVMAERVSAEITEEHHVGHDIAVHYFMALSMERDLQADKVANELKAKLNLQDPEAKVTRVIRKEYDLYYHLNFYDVACKRSLNIAFTLDGQNLSSEDWHDEFLAQMNQVINEHKIKIMTTRHPDCDAKGCQYAAEHGAEGSCAGRCYWVNIH